MSISKEILYGLQCGHAAPGPPTLVSGLLMCAWDRREFAIIGVIEYEWAADCQNCTFKRWAGLSKNNAGIFANGHVRHNPAHAVDIVYERNPTAKRTAEKFNAWKGHEDVIETGPMGKHSDYRNRPSSDVRNVGNR